MAAVRRDWLRMHPTIFLILTTCRAVARRYRQRLSGLQGIAAADEQAAKTLLHDLATVRRTREGTPQHNAGRWQRRVSRALDRVRYDGPRAGGEFVNADQTATVRTLP